MLGTFLNNGLNQNSEVFLFSFNIDLGLILGIIFFKTRLFYGWRPSVFYFYLPDIKTIFSTPST